MKKTLLFLAGMLLMVALPQGLKAQSDYGLTVSGTAVTAANAADVKGDGSVIFDADDNTLTLTGATVSGDIVWDGSHADLQSSNTLTIALSGDVSVNGQVRTTATDTAPLLTLVKVAGAEGCELTVNSGSLSKSAITGFTTLQHDGLTFTLPTWQSEVQYNTTNRELTELLGGLTSTILSKVTITSYATYPLWITGQQVTGGNNKGIETNGWQLTDGGMNRLVLEDYTLSGYNGDAIVSAIGGLTVSVAGTSRITCSGVAIKNVLTAASPALTFSAGGNAGILTLTSTGGSAVISGFGNDAAPTMQEPMVWVPVTTGDVVTGATILPCLGVTVYDTSGTAYPVTALNRTNVLGDGGTTATVQFDGHGRLVLNGASLSGITSTLTDGLEVYLTDQSTIQNSTYAITSTATGEVPLTFTTDGSAPGSLTYTQTARTLTTVKSAFMGFQTPVYQSNLAGVLTKGDVADEVGIFVPLSPVITPEQQQEATKTINYADPASSHMTASTVLNSVVIDDVLYTLADDGTAGSDGFDDRNGLVVLYTTLSDATVTAVSEQVDAQELIPGTDAYAAAFKGLTFVVPAGTGTVSLNTQTAAGYEFRLKIGSQDAVPVVSNADNGGADFEIPYAVSKATYVYLYLTAAASGAPGYNGHRAGPKGTISGGIGGLKVRSQVVSGVPDVAAEYHLMSPGDVALSTRSLKVAAAVTDLPASAFAGRDEMSFVDLTETQITGKRFSRSTGALAGLPETTFVYLPAGNTATGPNIVVGGICEQFVLDDTQDTFEVAADFTASKASYGREFTAGAGQYSTIFLPYAVKTSQVPGTFYEYDGYDASTHTARMKAVTAATLSANTPYIYKPSSDGAMPSSFCVTVEKTGSASAPEGSEGDGLHGVYEYHRWTSAPSDIYCYSATDQGSIKAGQFAKVGAGTFIRPFRAYLRISASSAPEFLSVDWGDGTTSIAPIDRGQVRQDSDGWFTVSGLRLPDKPEGKGVYIHQHQKVVVK